MRGFYEESPRIKKQRLAADATAKNPYSVKVGQVYRSWDPRTREQADDKVTRYTVATVSGSFAVCDTVLRYGQKRRASIRLDRFGPKNYKLLKDVP